MKVSCACPVDAMSHDLIEEIESLGLTPIVTPKVVRVVYEGDNVALGEAVVNLFERETDHEITACYDTNARAERRAQRKAIRKAEKAALNARLHGH